MKLYVKPEITVIKLYNGSLCDRIAITSEYAPPNIHGDAKENNDEWINTDNKNIWE